MNQNRKFEKAAQSRSQLALCVAVVLHVAVFAAIVYQAEMKKLMPDFIKELFVEPATPAHTASLI